MQELVQALMQQVQEQRSGRTIGIPRHCLRQASRVSGRLAQILLQQELAGSLVHEVGV